jgi:hypothetical protein
MVGTGDAAAPRVPQDRREHFITTLPGILAGAAALLTAAGTVAGVLWGTGAVGNKGATNTRASGIVVTLPYRPREGLATDGHIATSQNGPATLSAIGQVRTLWATFRLALLPSSGHVAVQWLSPSGRVLVAVNKEPTPKVVSYLSATRGTTLESGKWVAELVVGGTILRSSSINVASSFGTRVAGNRTGRFRARGRYSSSTVHG